MAIGSDPGTNREGSVQLLSRGLRGLSRTTSPEAGCKFHLRMRSVREKTFDRALAWTYTAHPNGGEFDF
jgi:hypothetical protein